MPQFKNPSSTNPARHRFWTRRPWCEVRRRFLPRVDLMEDRTLLSTLTVTNNKDSGSGSLRATIAAAASGDTIAFANSLKGQTIKLTTGELEITTSLTIEGPGWGSLTVNGEVASRVLRNRRRQLT